METKPLNNNLCLLTEDRLIYQPTGEYVTKEDFRDGLKRIDREDLWRGIAVNTNRSVLSLSGISIEDKSIRRLYLRGGCIVFGCCDFNLEESELLEKWSA